MEIPIEKIQLVNYSDIYRRNMMSLFLYVFTDKNTYIGEYRGTHKWKSWNEKTLGKYFLVIFIKKIWRVNSTDKITDEN